MKFLGNLSDNSMFRYHGKVNLKKSTFVFLICKKQIFQI